MIIDCDIIIEDEEGNVVEQPEAELSEEVFDEKLSLKAGTWPFDTK